MVNRRLKNILLISAALAIFVVAKVGCEYFPESSFELANESRLPKWFNLPPGLARSDVSVTMNYYSVPWGSDVTFILHGTKKHKLAKTDGKTIKSSPQNDPTAYPAYKLITANGVADIVEHKKMEPIFYITDDPAVWKELMGVQPVAGGPVISPK